MSRAEIFNTHVHSLIEDDTDVLIRDPEQTMSVAAQDNIQYLASEELPLGDITTHEVFADETLGLVVLDVVFDDGSKTVVIFEKEEGYDDQCAVHIPHEGEIEVLIGHIDDKIALLKLQREKLEAVS